jgi:tungstate transport system permease protein
VQDLLREVGAALELLASGDPELWGIVGRTLMITGTSTAISAVVALPVGAWLGASRRPRRGLLVGLMSTGMALPPVVVGLFVALMLEREGPLGALGWLYTPQAMVVAQVIIAAPVIASVAAIAFEQADPELRAQLRALGASRVRATMLVAREVRRSLVVAVLAGFGSVMAEAGAALIVGGNIAGQTRVMTTAIVLGTSQGDYAGALALGMILVALTAFVNVAATLARPPRTGVA